MNTPAVSPSAPFTGHLTPELLSKVTWRLVPYLILLYFIAFLDRVNVGFASLTMNKDLGIPPEVAIEEFLNRARPEVMIEISPLEPETGEPAITHIRGAFARHIHVITANKGPIAHAYDVLRAEALAAGVEFRFESTVMDGSPVFSDGMLSLSPEG